MISETLLNQLKMHPSYTELIGKKPSNVKPKLNDVKIPKENKLSSSDNEVGDEAKNFTARKDSRVESQDTQIDEPSISCLDDDEFIVECGLKQLNMQSSMSSLEDSMASLPCIEASEVSEESLRSMNFAPHNRGRGSNPVGNAARSEKQTEETLYVEVAPGQKLVLRRGQETVEARENGDAIEVMCLGCDSKLSCVPDCECVICPGCYAISPLLLSNGESTGSDHQSRWCKRRFGNETRLTRRNGVGFGLRV